MTPADFTIEFYRKCLSQAKWNSEDSRDKESINMLLQVAKERGGEFLDEYSTAYAQATHFPVASQEATETQNQTPKTNTPMNTLLNDFYNILVKPLVEAIDRNTAAKGNVIALEAATPQTVTPLPDGTEQPKKRGPKAKAEAAPAPEPEPTPVVEEEPYMSGADLVELMKPLKDTAFSKQLVEFRNTTVGFNKPTREMTDPVMLRQMEAKIREFLAANEAANEEA
jgi:hypothetical protein